MALTLNDFNSKPNQKEQLRMEAFQPRSRPSPAANPATINTIATLGAALEPSGNLDGAFKAISNELAYSPTSTALDKIITSWDNNDVQTTMNTLRTVLSDPNVSDQDKQAVLYAHQDNQLLPSSLGVRVATAAAEAPSPGETMEGEDIRAMLAAGYDEVDKYNAWAQQQLNALNNEANPQWHQNVKILAESFLPFLDAADAAIFENAVAGGQVEGAGGIGNTLQTLFLMGEGKNRLREALDKMPVDQRQPVVQNLINTVKSMQGTITTDTSTLRAIRNLEQMISVGGYSQEDRWVDDFFSVLDATVILAPARRLLQGAGDVLKGGKEARLNEEILRRGDLAEDAAPAAGGASEAVGDAPMLQIEYKPTPVSYGDDIENVIERMPIEPTFKEIEELRAAMYDELGNPAGFSIDNVIDKMSAADRMTASQIADVRQAVGPVAIKRRNELNGVVPTDQGTFAEVQRVHISGNVQPTSVSQVYKDTNPQLARTANQTMVADTSGRAAELLYGTDRASAIANDFGPEIGGGTRVRHKLDYEVTDAQPDMKIAQHIKDSDGAVWANKTEKIAARAAVIDEWKNVAGLAPRTSMQTISSITPKASDLSNGVRFQQIYGPKDHGFKDAAAGMEVVKAALRKYGIDDKDLNVLARQPDGLYGPVREGQDLRNGDFVVQVNYDYTFDPKDINYEGFDIGRLWGFLPIPDVHLTGKTMGSQGGFTQMIIPKSVNIDKTAYTAGVSAADKASGLQQKLLGYGKKVADGFKKLDRNQQSLVDQYIRMANDREIKFNPGNIRAAGISEDGLQVLHDWKTVQDTLWTMENADVNKTLRNRGYQYYINSATDTKLLVKPIEARGSNVALRDYLLPDGKVGKYSNEQLDDLYEKGGYVAELRKPEDFNGETVSHVIVKNSANEGYARAIRDDDTTLGYRHGYYHVRYTDPYYITAKGPDGTTKTIARAASKKDADAELSRLRSSNDGVEYDYKYDRNLNIDAAFDDELDVAFNSGRSTQRLRGKRLTRVGHDKTISDAGMESPVDSLVRSIASISNRTVFRNVIEADKRRWLTSFKHLLPKDRQFVYPANISDIRGGDGAHEARHAFRYIESLESGYGNLIDDASKIFFSKVADVSAGSKSFGWVEKIARNAAGGSPSAFARMTAFRLFLAANPLRQLPLQMAPALPIIASLNPRGFGKVFKQGTLLAAWHRGVDVSTSLKVSKMSGLTLDEMKDLIKDYELSGMSSAVNAHSYLADDLARLADKNVAQKAASTITAPLRVAQTIGFDFGEQSLMTMVWISERDRMLRNLKKTSLDAAEREELTAKVRAITGDMNRGGDMPYNSNTFSVVMQFMQNPHKIASGLILGHRNLTLAERAKLATGYTVTFGVPTVLGINMFIDKILPPEETELKDLVKGGLVNLALNRSFSALTGTDVNVDFSGGIQPFSTEPMTELVGSIMSMSLSDALMDRAAISLIADDGRINNFFRAVAAPFIPGEYENVDEVKQIGLTFLQMFSGTSNFLKAQYILENQKIVTNTGQVVDDDVSYMEAMWKAAGFQSVDEVRYWDSNKLLWEAGDKLDADIDHLLDNLFTMYTRENLSPADMQQYSAVMAEAFRVFKGNQVVLKKVEDRYKMRIKSNPDVLYNTLMKNSGLYNPADIPRILNNSNLSQEQIDNVMAMYNTTGDLYGD